MTRRRRPSRRFALETLVQLAGPMLPHLAEELWQRLGHARAACGSAMAGRRPGLLVEERVTIGVQVNGKLRGILEVARDADDDDARTAALALPAVAKAIAGKTPRSVIVVRNRIVNVVV